MKLSFLLALLAASGLAWAPASNAVAANLARKARQARDSGQLVRAYMLYAEAAAREPQNVTYRNDRDVLASAAHLLTKADIQSADIGRDIALAQEEAKHSPAPIERVSVDEWYHDRELAPIPQVVFSTQAESLDLRADAKSLLGQVTQAFGVKAIVDDGVSAGQPLHFELAQSDFRSALDAVTGATHTFVFPVGRDTVYFAPDTEIKRNQLEPLVLTTFTLNEALNERDLIEVANAVRNLLNLRTIGWDSLNRTILIRDRASRVKVARAVMESLLLPRAQVSFELEFLICNTDDSSHYGASLQTLYQVINFGAVQALRSVLPNPINTTKFLAFGGGASLFGVGIADATLFAGVSNSISRTLYDTTVVVSDRGTADFHIGDKYPIPTSLYTGFNTGAASIYQPVPQITLEDLGLVLKITPHVNGGGDMRVDVEAEFKSLGTLTVNTVPSIEQRSFKGSVNIREGQWAVLAGIDAASQTFSRSGLAGLINVPGLNQVLSETNRDKQTSNTLIVLKPTITRLPMSEAFSPQFLLGTMRGSRVIL